MSGSGGYYKYRCKHWLTYNCPHWVWVNGAACAHCMALGRAATTSVASSHARWAHEVYVPAINNRTLTYVMREIITNNQSNGRWQLKEEPAQCYPIPASDLAGLSYATHARPTEGRQVSENGMHPQREATDWADGVDVQ
ncbi:MAG: hypothetical protein M1818_001793 [Claussenomyces sp. TS43310]|nr:MAG: hypothetical protein M1818_001793 [Claussenomyces sp. TS43310]